MFNATRFIEEVQKRPSLWQPMSNTSDRIDRLTLWKEVGESLFCDWHKSTKATKYDRVLLMQKRWRSYKDSYNRELRLRRQGANRRRPYVFYKYLKFLGGHEGIPEIDEDDFPQTKQEALTRIIDTSDQNNDCEDDGTLEYLETDAEAMAVIKKKVKSDRAKRKRKKHAQDEVPPSSMLEVTLPEFDSQDDSERLFLTSFAPEMKRLPPNLKMWVRSQIANVMQEAVNCSLNNTLPGAEGGYDATNFLMTDLKRSSSYTGSDQY